MLCRLLMVSALVWAGVTSQARASGDPVVVFAAASLKTALDEVAAGYRAQGGAEIRISYAGSSALARQIESGAPAALFISANALWMDALEADGALATGTRRDLLTNRLVLIAAPGNDIQLPLEPGADLIGALAEGRLAVALVRAVPAGIYAREALEALGPWHEIEPRLAQTDNVRAALRLVALGEAPLGIVYATDAAADIRVRVVDEFASELHAPIRYPAAILGSGDTAEARAFFAFLFGDAAAKVFRGHGFGLAEGGA